jgi:hypothetical protein
VVSATHPFLQNGSAKIETSSPNNQIFFKTIFQMQP